MFKSTLKITKSNDKKIYYLMKLYKKYVTNQIQAGPILDLYWVRLAHPI